MWICSSLGFFSVVEKLPGEFHIRARRKKDLENLKKAAKTVTKIHVTDDPGTDYHFRIVCNGAAWRKYSDVLATSVNYPNFKSRIRRDPDQWDKLRIYSDFHHQMEHFQNWRGYLTP